jgi:hypothetical protein
MNTKNKMFNFVCVVSFVGVVPNAVGAFIVGA